MFFIRRIESVFNRAVDIEYTIRCIIDEQRYNDFLLTSARTSNMAWKLCYIGYALCPFFFDSSPAHPFSIPNPDAGGQTLKWPAAYIVFFPLIRPDSDD